MTKKGIVSFTKDYKPTTKYFSNELAILIAYYHAK